MRLVKTLFVLCAAILLVGVAFHTAVFSADGGKPLPAPLAVQSSVLLADGGHPLPTPPVALLADGGHPLPTPPAYPSTVLTTA